VRPDVPVWTRALVLVLLFWGAGPESFVAPVRAETEVIGEIGMGYDTNAYRESSSETTSGMMPMSLSLNYERLPSELSRVAAALKGTGSLYPEANRDGSTWSIDGKAGYERRLIGGDRRFVRSPSLDLSLGGGYDELHRVYFSRTAGEEFLVIVDGDTVSLRNRYNFRELGGNGSLTMRWPRSTQWTIESAVSRRNYLDDYRDVPTVDPLDYNRMIWNAGVRQSLFGPMRIDLSYGRERVDYDSLTARDLDGNIVPGEVQQYSYRRTEATLSNRDLDWGHAKIVVHYKKRIDPFMGYYDYTQWGIRPFLRLTVIPGTYLLLSYDYVHRDYERARVGYNPVNPLREDFDRSTTAQVLYHVRTGQALIAQVVHQSTTEKNPAYTYKRTRTWLGYQFRL
jgi:hypothetical protein